MSHVEMLGQSPIASDRQARPLSPATRAGDFVFVSGQVPTDDQGQVHRVPMPLRLRESVAPLA